MEEDKLDKIIALLAEVLERLPSKKKKENLDWEELFNE